MFTIKYNTLHYSKYLNNCDLYYKYNINSINNLPLLEKIIIELPTNTLPNINVIENDYQYLLLLKCFLFFYFINNKLVYINCNKFKKNNYFIKDQINNFNYAYLATYNSFFEKYNFLLSLLNENDYINNTVKIITSLSTKLNSSVDNSKTINFRLEIAANNSIEYKNTLNTLYNRAEIQNIKIKLNLVFNTFNNKLLTINELKNIFYIWNL